MNAELAICDGGGRRRPTRAPARLPDVTLASVQPADVQVANDYLYLDEGIVASLEALAGTRCVDAAVALDVGKRQLLDRDVAFCFNDRQVYPSVWLQRHQDVQSRCMLVQTAQGCQPLPLREQDVTVTGGISELLRLDVREVCYLRLASAATVLELKKVLAHRDCYAPTHDKAKATGGFVVRGKKSRVVTCFERAALCCFFEFWGIRPEKWDLYLAGPCFVWPAHAGSPMGHYVVWAGLPTGPENDGAVQVHDGFIQPGWPRA